MQHYRLLEENLQKHFEKYRQALILLGSRQVGKTTLLKKIFPQAKYLLVDEKIVFNTLNSYDSNAYKALIGSSKQIFIDELHLLSDPGRAVKLIYDQLDTIQIIVTGSSSLHIKNKTAESMAGRAIDYNLHPLTYWEFLYQQNIELNQKKIITNTILDDSSTPYPKNYDIDVILENLLIFGQYPHLVSSPRDKKYLKNLVEKAIFKDILNLNLIENRVKALELLKLLAYQIGNLISYSELSKKIGISTPTIQRYIDIFEQSFILYRIYPFSQNPREEIGKTPKIYFWDLGLRNALINNFDSLIFRSDAGAIFENFIITEIKKEIDYLDLDFKINYWRLKSGSEVDLVLSNHQKLIGCEIKYTMGKVSTAFKNRYPTAQTRIISASNFI